MTICTQNRELLFGDVIDGKMELNDMGKIVDQTIQLLPQRFPINIPIYQIMPNHLYAIITIVGAHHDAPLHNRAIHESPLRKRSLLSQIIGFLKMNSSKLIHVMANHDLPIWQRNYFEHIIRNDIELNKIREYIILNPQMWERDRNNPENLYV